ncbi:MAG TPA: PLP-dependent aminotransferase family protein [Solirubrobacteraceae bacterium]|nr:PLP-dependent aminotransferase family protein [Solirubrobacteraceae bacterium]
MGATETGWSFARRTHSFSSELTTILAGSPPGVLSLAGGFPNPATFPTEVLDDTVERLVRDDAGVALQYAPCEGVPSFRSYLADRQEQTQGRRPELAELMVTSGGMECIALACQALVDPGDPIAVEAPTYLGALMAFARYEADVHGIAMDADGIVVEALAERLEAGLRPKLLYVIPDYQNPSGRTLTLQRRHALVELCRRHGVLVLEDVAYRELSFDGTALPSLWSLAPDVVLQAGTFSKLFAPGVRLGWAAGPAAVVAELAAAKQTTDQCSGALGQRLVEEYGRAGNFERRLPAARELYATHWRAVRRAFEQHMPDGCTWSEPAGGFFAWLRLPDGLDAVELRAAAAEGGVAYVPGAPFYSGDGGRDELRLAFSYLSEDDLGEAVRRLAEVIS